MGYPLVRKLIPEITRGLFRKEYEIERSCPKCGAEESYLAWRRGIVSEDAKKIYEEALVAARRQEMLRSLRHALFIFFFVLFVMFVMTLGSQ